MFYRRLLLICLVLFCQTAYSLDSDSEQPATLDADDMEMDFSTGVRIYRGNVVFVQGSIRMTCDELTTYFSDDGELDEAICVGGPARFKQRPEGQEEDMIGIASTITMNRVEDLVTLKSQAQVIQGDSTITGRLITYNMATEKASVKGGGGQATASTGTASTGTSTEDPSAATGEAAAEAAVESSRPSLTIQPRKKKTEEQPAAAGSAEADTAEDTKADKPAKTTAE